MVRKGFLVLGFLCASFSTAAASRADLDARAFPRLLAIDASLLRIVPGSASLFGRQFTVDYSQFSSNDRFAMAMVGNKTRFAYVLDGDTHNVLVGTSGGFGAVLGFSDTYVKSERTFQTFSNGSVNGEVFQETESVDTAVRLGLGFQNESDSGYIFELGASGTYLNVERSSREAQASMGSSEETVLSWKSDPGFVLDGVVRIVRRDSGFMVAGGYSFEELNPDVTLPIGLTANSQLGSFDFGWRLNLKSIEDVVVGWTSTYGKQTDLNLYGSASRVGVREETTKDYRGGLFVSADHEVVQGLFVRGGIRALGMFEERIRRDWLFVDGDLSDAVEWKVSNGRILAPEVSIGAGWHWKSLILDVQVQEQIDLDDPFVRWAATFTL